MRFTRLITFLFIAAMVVSACDHSEQNYEIEPGNSLAINGDTEVTVPDTVEYYVQAFTIEKDYTWSVDGEAPDSTWRDGEFIAVDFQDPGTYTINVESSGQGDDYEGSLEVEASLPEDDG